MKRLLFSPDSAEMGLLKSRLEEAGIPCFLQNEQTSQTIHAAAFSADLFVVNDEDYGRAVDLCESWRHPAFEGHPAWTCPNCGEALEGQFGACWKCGIKRDADASTACGPPLPGLQDGKGNVVSSRETFKKMMLLSNSCSTPPPEPAADTSVACQSCHEALTHATPTKKENV